MHLTLCRLCENDRSNYFFSFIFSESMLWRVAPLWSAKTCGDAAGARLRLYLRRRVAIKCANRVLLRFPRSQIKSVDRIPTPSLRQYSARHGPRRANNPLNRQQWNETTFNNRTCHASVGAARILSEVRWHAVDARSLPVVYPTITFADEGVIINSGIVNRNKKQNR